MQERNERRNERRGQGPGIGVVAGTLVACAVLGVLLVRAADASTDSGVRDATVASGVYAPPARGTYTPPVAAAVRDPFRMDHGLYGPGNRGLEYASGPGQPVRTIGSGVVVFAGAVAGRLAVTVVHPDGRRSSLTGLVSLAVRVGDMVRRGSLIGAAGEGLHLGVREGDRYVDPAGLFSAVRRRAVLIPLGPPVPD